MVSNDVSSWVTEPKKMHQEYWELARNVDHFVLIWVMLSCSATMDAGGSGGRWLNGRMVSLLTDLIPERCE